MATSDNTVRHRQSFLPPKEDDMDSGPVEMDEQEQEELITRLKATDSDTIDLYQTLFFGVTFVAICLYFVFTPGFYLSLLAITSLAASAFVLHLPLPNTQTIWTIDLPPTSPIVKFLPALNGALAMVIALQGFATRSSSPPELLLFQVLPICRYHYFVYLRANWQQSCLSSLQWFVGSLLQSTWTSCPDSSTTTKEPKIQ